VRKPLDMPSREKRSVCSVMGRRDGAKRQGRERDTGHGACHFVDRQEHIVWRVGRCCWTPQQVQTAGGWHDAGVTTWRQRGAGSGCSR
jgi:hypothetical protein